MITARRSKALQRPMRQERDGNWEMPLLQLMAFLGFKIRPFFGRETCQLSAL